MAKEIGRYVFRTGEGGDRGKPVFIWLELQQQPPISVFANALVTLELRNKQDLAKAKDVAAFLNDHIEAIGDQPE